MIAKGALSHLARPGTTLAVRVQPGARRDSVEPDGDGLRVSVTAAPEGGKANAAVTAAVARALGIAKGRVTVLRGTKSRDKVLQID